MTLLYLIAATILILKDKADENILLMSIVFAFIDFVFIVVLFG